MIVKIVSSIAGHAEPRYGLQGFSFAPGETVLLHDELAKAWIASGVAEALPAPKVQPKKAEPPPAPAPISAPQPKK